MIFLLGRRKEAPQWVTSINASGVPAIAVFASSVVGLSLLCSQLFISRTAKYLDFYFQPQVQLPYWCIE